MDSIFNLGLQPEFNCKQFVNDEKSLRQIWVSLLDKDIFKKQQFEKENEDECAFTMLLQAISLRFQSKLKINHHMFQ